MEQEDQSSRSLELDDDTYTPEAAWAKEHHISKKTCERYRAKGLPFLEWGGEIWIGDRGGDEYIASRVTRRNPPRKPRTRGAGRGA